MKNLEFKEYLMINRKYFSIRWFKEYYEWFFYVEIFGCGVRFSSAGFMTYRLKK